MEGGDILEVAQGLGKGLEHFDVADRAIMCNSTNCGRVSYTTIKNSNKKILK